jgi:hypothetical protein
MVFSRIFKSLTAIFRPKGPKVPQVSDGNYELLNAGENASIYPENEETHEIYSVWDYLEFTSNTQAFHLSKIIGFDEWVSMDEIKRRVKELFGVDYKNDRSLYPYIKTLVDCGLFETSNVGGKRKWRKKDLLIKVEKKKKEKKQAVLSVS